MIKVKICGITNIEDALIAQDAGADMLGLIFAESPRKITVDIARDILAKISDRIETVALFVNEDEGVVKRTLNKLKRIDLIQFHGDETQAYCRQFNDKKIIKAFRVKDEGVLKDIEAFGRPDILLLDAFSKEQFGGTGKRVDWNIALKAKDHGVPLLLSGGLNPDNVSTAIEKVRPYGVDVSSGVEKEPGKKDPLLVRSFIRKAKAEV